MPILSRRRLYQPRACFDPQPSGGTYVGHGDIASFDAWGGVRGYSAAYSTGSNPAADVVDQSGANALNGVVILSNGDLDQATLSAWVTAHGVTDIRVMKLYDQTGNSRHFTATSAAAAPSLTISGLNSRPVLNFSSARTTLLSGGIFGTTLNLAHPFSYAVVAAITGSLSSGQSLIIDSNNQCEIGKTSTSNLWQMYAGAPLTATANDNAPHAAVAAFISTGSGDLFIDGTSTSGNPSLGTNSTAVMLLGSVFGGGQYVDGYMTQAGVALSDLSAHASALIANDRAYYGF